MSVSATLLAVLMMSDSTASATADKPKNDEDKLICRRELETGSLVRSTRRCYTRKEWARITEEARKDVEEMRRRSGPIAGQ